MAPVKKQKANKSSEIIKKQEKVLNNDSVVSGQLQKKINKKQQKPQKDPKGVVFIKHLPHGFFEEQLKKYFEQFGNVTRLRLARSRRTGNSKGYAFVEFEYPEVAEVAAETMNNYLMFKQIVKASYIPPEKQQFNYFRTSVKKIRNKSGKTVWVSGKTASIQQKMKKHNDWSEENYQKRTQKQLEKLKKIGEKYAHLGIDVNKIIIQPNVLKGKEKKLQQKSKVDELKEEKPVGHSKLKKRKISKDVSSNKQIKLKKSKNTLSLEDLLGDTLQEDSEDEDYYATDSEDDTEETESSLDDETYGFEKDLVDSEEQLKFKKAKSTLSLEDLLGDTLQEDSEDEDYYATDSEDDTEETESSLDDKTYGFEKDLVESEEQFNSENESDEEKEEASPVLEKNPKKNFGKPLRSSNVERFDKMLKRKPHTGGINKLNKKPSKQTSQPQKSIAAKKKNALKMTAAKELAKPLSKIKDKLGKPLKAKKNLIKIK